MKGISLFFLNIILVYVSVAQNKPSANGSVCGGNIYNPWGYINYYRDTIQNPNCIWQTGMPQKPIFNPSVTALSVFVTDTLTPYPVNDTSSFILEQELVWSTYNYNAPHWFWVEGEYYINSDSLTDFGTIEISMKGTNVWYNVVEDTRFGFFPFAKPILTGNSNGWKSFRIDFKIFGDLLNIKLQDTMLLRFSFISDSVQTNKDGLMFRCFNFMDFFESVAETVLSIPSKSYPNPASELLDIELPTKNVFKNAKLSVFNSIGRNILSKEFKDDDKIQIFVREFPKGMYYYMLDLDKKAFSTGKFIVD